MSIKLPSAIKSFGNSMSPILQNKDIVFLRKIKLSKIEVNDLICYQNKNFVTHRVIYKRPNNSYIITKGDNNFYPDKKVFPNKIYGKVTKVKRSGRIIKPDDIYLLQSTFYFQEIVKINEEFKKDGINFVILKGLPLHLFFEKAHPKRIYADCDLLIDPKQLQAAEKLLNSLGFIHHDPSFTKTHKLLKNKETVTTFVKFNKGFQIILDIHAEPAFLMHQLGRLDHLYPQTLLNNLTKKFLKDKTEIRVQGCLFPILNLEDLILYLCLHLFHHNFRGYHRYQFIDFILRNQKIDFDKLAREISSFKLNNFVFPVFKLLKKHYLIQIKANFLQKITPAGSVRDYIDQKVINIPIFEEEFRINAGVERFLLIYNLSPSPKIKKILTFADLQVLYSIFWVVKGKLGLIPKKIT